MRLVRATWEVCCYIQVGIATESRTPGDSFPEKAARRAIESLAEMEPELRRAAVFAGDGAAGPVLATTGDPDWTETARRLAGELAAATPGDFDSAHVALDSGEVFVLADAGYTLVATTGRFVLASLTRFDARMCLRDLAAERGGKD